MSIFDFAMQMELDGKSYYEEMAAKADVPQLKSILLEMADDEQKHYKLFKAMRDGETATYDTDQASKIFASAKNVFEELKESGEEITVGSDVREAWVQAREIEKKAEAFYLQKADEVDDDDQKQTLVAIAKEECKHWTVIEHVISFLDQPGAWIENAEWSDLGEK